MKNDGILSIDSDAIEEVEFSKIQVGDCLVVRNKLYIVTEVVLRPEKKSGHLPGSYYIAHDFCTNERKLFPAIHIRNRSEKYDDVDNTYVKRTKIHTNDYLLMSVDEFDRLCLLDLNNNEIKENVIVNLEAKESKNNLNLVKRLLNESKEVTVTTKTVADVTIIARVIAEK